jgi:hemerythrin-like domain-containing protein
MRTEIAEILIELRRDHRNMALLLNIVERESERIHEESVPDFELLHDVMHYMTVYPDAVHHPKEDRLYHEMVKVRPDLTAGFQRISLDHREIGEQGSRLRNAFASIDSGVLVRRNLLVADALRYVNALRSHMQWEEIDLFRRCTEMANDGHRLIVDKGPVNVRDPLFGNKVSSEFARLFDSIKAADDEQRKG